MYIFFSSWIISFKTETEVLKEKAEFDKMMETVESQKNLPENIYKNIKAKTEDEKKMKTDESQKNPPENSMDKAEEEEKMNQPAKRIRRSTVKP